MVSIRGSEDSDVVDLAYAAVRSDTLFEAEEGISQH
jgi:hypothetical protein